MVTRSSITMTTTKLPKVSSCVRCGSDDIEIHDCGYSSFNAGHARCRECGYNVDISNHNDERDVILKWNRERARLMKHIVDSLTEVEKIRKMLEDDRIRREKKNPGKTIVLPYMPAFITPDSVFMTPRDV